MSTRTGGKTIKMPKWAKVRLALDHGTREQTATLKRMLLSAIAAEEAVRTGRHRRDEDR